MTKIRRRKRQEGSGSEKFLPSRFPAVFSLAGKRPACLDALRSMRTRAMLIIGCIALASCSVKPQPLPPQEVLKRALIAGHTLQSARFDAAAVLSPGDGAQLKLSAIGVLKGYGTSFRLEGSGKLLGSAGLENAGFSGDVVLPGSGEAYLRVDKLEIPGRQEVLEALFGTDPEPLAHWWVTGYANSKEMPLAPDASMIDSQLSALRMEKDDGLEKSGEEYEYHYELSVDREALQGLADSGLPPAGRGDVWIDARTFALRRAAWTLEDIPMGNWSVHLYVDVRFSAHNQDVQLEIPYGQIPSLPQESIFATVFSGALLP